MPALAVMTARSYLAARCLVLEETPWAAVRSFESQARPAPLQGPNIERAPRQTEPDSLVGQVVGNEP
ncbi:Hypothetical protein NTJ_03172 [Nesidiocoris tenuis]|uniref:Uncharacterized protein n=1 Tax=Nesidiocoris tenuis TaxID=355587 RepID=A0ABN7AG79_9HEMI|nr:Hypothetical protein NTJ_03172 [Nesidiocoris tenuis]